MIPVSLSSSLGMRRPVLDQVMAYAEGRLGTELKELAPVAIESRLKGEASILSKLQTGRYGSIDEVQDLIGIKVVVLYRKQLEEAIQIVRVCGLRVQDPPDSTLAPTDLRYRSPKLYVAPSDDYVARNPEVDGVVVEVQFTTALQHALDMATHDFDYKGQSYSWGNFRLVAQLRGALELIDSILDDVASASVLAESMPAKPPTYEVAESISMILKEKFGADALPADMRRMTDVVAAWAAVVGISAPDLGELLDRQGDLVAALSVDATSAVLGALLREHGGLMLSQWEDRLLISSELESLCVEAARVPRALDMEPEFL